MENVESKVYLQNKCTFPNSTSYFATYPHELGLIKVHVFRCPGGVGQVPVDVLQVHRVVSYDSDAEKGGRGKGNKVQ